MNSIIWKYEIPNHTPQGTEVQLPIGAEILHAGMQRVNKEGSENEYENKIFVWALVDPEAELETKTIFTAWTGVSFTENAKHISTFIDDITRLVYHIFVGI